MFSHSYFACSMFTGSYFTPACAAPPPPTPTPKGGWWEWHKPFGVPWADNE